VFIVVYLVSALSVTCSLLRLKLLTKYVQHSSAWHGYRL